MQSMTAFGVLARRASGCRRCRARRRRSSPRRSIPRCTSRPTPSARGSRAWRSMATKRSAAAISCARMRGDRRVAEAVGRGDQAHLRGGRHVVPAELAGRGLDAGLRRVEARLRELGLVVRLSGRDVELRRGPVELVAGVAVAVDAAALDLRLGGRSSGSSAPPRRRSRRRSGSAPRTPGSSVFQRRAACAAAAARFSVAAVLTGRRKRLMSSLSGAVGIADHFSPCIFWWAMPGHRLARRAPASPAAHSRPKRASSSRSGRPFLPSGMFSLPSPKSPAVLPNFVQRLVLVLQRPDARSRR